MAGIPLAITGIVLFLVLPWSEWYWALAAFAGGYGLQFIGHRVSEFVCQNETRFVVHPKVARERARGPRAY